MNYQYIAIHEYYQVHLGVMKFVMIWSDFLNQNSPLEVEQLVNIWFFQKLRKASCKQKTLFMNLSQLLW